MLNEKKRLFAMLMITSGVCFHLTSVSTDFWLQRASPVRSLSQINLSQIVMWKSLIKVCLKMPPLYQVKCADLETFGMENGSIEAVRWLLYLPIGIGIVEILVMLICYLLTKQFFMDLMAIASFVIVILSATGLGIFTRDNPTLFSFFLLYGYSYICAWLGTCCHLVASLLALLFRLDDNGDTFLSNNSFYRKKPTATERTETRTN